VRPADQSLACHAQRYQGIGDDGHEVAVTLRCWSSRPGLRLHRADHILAIIGPALQRRLSAYAAWERSVTQAEKSPRRKLHAGAPPARDR
jgi:hypothetical protein